MNDPQTKFEIPTCDFCFDRIRLLFSDQHGEVCDDIHIKTGCRCNFCTMGEPIFSAGENPKGLYIINRGKVKIYKTGEFGKEHIVRLADAGDVIGYRSLISNEPYSATAAPIEDTCLCFVPKNVFFQILTNHPEISMNVLKLLTSDLGAAEQKLSDLALKPVRERLAVALLSLAKTYGMKENNATINVELKREELAQLVGTATEGVIRLLADFKKDKMIEVEGRLVTIVDREKLSKTAYILD